MTWKKKIHTTAGVDWEYVVPERRLRQQVNQAGEKIGSEDFLSFRDGEAYGSFLTINYIYFVNIGNKALDELSRRWTLKVLPNLEPFTKVLRSRYASEATNLENILGAPESYADGWVQYKWKAFDEASLYKIVPEGMWAGFTSDFQMAWHGTKLECIYKTMVDGCLSEITCLRRRIKDGKPGL